MSIFGDQTFEEQSVNWRRNEMERDIAIQKIFSTKKEKVADAPTITSQEDRADT